jgi:histone-lysine N-methyltransferase MLL1
VGGARSIYLTGVLFIPENKRDAAASFNQLGLTHRAVQFLLEQLPGINKAAKEQHVFKFHDPPKTSIEDTPVAENPSGCARSEGYAGRKPFDMFGWLASKHRQPLVLDNNSRK